MNEQKLLAYLAKEMVKEKAAQVDFLAAGRAADYAEYRHICGVIRGLDVAESLVNNLVQKMEEDDE